VFTSFKSPDFFQAIIESKTFVAVTQLAVIAVFPGHLAGFAVKAFSDEFRRDLWQEGNEYSGKLADLGL